jgi:hypothetical protein
MDAVATTTHGENECEFAVIAHESSDKELS